MIVTTTQTAGLQKLLDGPHQELRRQVREWLRDPVFTRQSDLSLAERRQQTWLWCQELGKRGLTRLALPRELGGEGNFTGMLAAFQELAYFDVSLVIKLGVQVGLFGGSLMNLGTKKHHELLRQAIMLELPGCFAMTETDHGSNVRDLETVARYDQLSEEIVVHTPHDGARKDYIGNAACHARMATVFAQLEVDGKSHGVHAVLVPIRDEQGRPLPGIRIEDCGKKLGLNGVDNGRIWFDHVRVPKDNLLDRFAQITPEGNYRSRIQSPTRRFFTMLSTLVTGRVFLSAAATSAAKAGVSIAVEYGSKRRQFGPARSGRETLILDYQAHQRRLMPALASCFAFEFASRALVERQAQGDPEAELLAAALKPLITWETMSILQTTRECCGGQGYLWENRFADLKADLDVFTTFEGDNTVLLQLVAKGLLGEYRKQFQLKRLVGHLLGRAREVLSDMNPVVPHMVSEEHLRDREFQLSVFRSRESMLLVSAAKRVKKRLDQGMSPLAAFNDCQDHMLALGRAYAERIVLEEFARAAGSAPPELQSQLKELCDLYALSRLYDDRAWFLEHGYFEPAKSKAVRDLVLKLCALTRANALPLVRAFGIPEHALDAPIARS